MEIMQGLLSLAEPSALLLAPTEPPRAALASTSGRSAVSSAGRRPTLAAATAHLPRLDTATALGRSVAQRAPARHAHSNAVFVRRHADHTRDVVLRHNHRRSELPVLPAIQNAKQAQAQVREGRGWGGVVVHMDHRARFGAEPACDPEQLRDSQARDIRNPAVPRQPFPPAP